MTRWSTDRARWLIAAVGTLVPIALLGPTAHADTPPEHGYWWRGQLTGPVLSPAPPTVPPDGLWIAHDGMGAHAVSALRAEVSGAAIEQLRLVIADTVGTPAVVACPAASDWVPVEAGPFDDAPSADCDSGRVTGIVGEASDGSAVLTFDLSSLGGDGAIDVVLLPVPAEPTPFSVTFEPPTDAITVSIEPTAPAPTSGPTPPSDPPEPEAAWPRDTPPAGADAFVLPTPPPPAIPPPEVADAPSAGTGEESAPQDPAVAQPSPSGIDGLAPAGRGEPLALLPIIALAGAWILRGRTAVARSGAHPLAEPLRGADTIDTAALLAMDARQENTP